MRWIVSVGTMVLIGVAVGLGLAGVYRAQAYLNHRAELHFEAQKGLFATKTSVSARAPHGLDSEPVQSAMGEIDRSADMAVPDDAAAIPRITGSTERNTPAVIQGNWESRATDLPRPHQPVSPRAILGEGKKAVAIRIANVESIAGFLVPDQPVDVVLTRQLEGNSLYNEVVAQNARMLATDRLADDRN